MNQYFVDWFQERNNLHSIQSTLLPLTSIVQAQKASLPPHCGFSDSKQPGPLTAYTCGCIRTRLVLGKVLPMTVDGIKVLETENALFGTTRSQPIDTLQTGVVPESDIGKNWI